jgi:DNA polymerase-3 subunit gamma/tau
MAPGDGALDAAAVRRVWDEVLTVVRRRSQRSWAVVREAVVRDVHGDEIVLVFQHLVHMNMFGAQADLLAEAVREVFGGSWRLRAELGGDEAARSAPASSRPSATSGTPTVGTPSAGAPASAGKDGEDGWPTTAPLGSGPAQPPPPALAPAKKARPAARQGGAGRTDGTPPARNRPPAAQDAAADEEDEPPWDPDYDPAPGSVPAPPPKESTEEQAIRVLTETLGAERIDR